MFDRSSTQALRDMLAERDSASCAQSGLNGPPWSAAGKTRLTRSMSRWLPWNWYSLDGTGWCYDAEWDEMQAKMGKASRRQERRFRSPLFRCPLGPQKSAYQSQCSASV